MVFSQVAVEILVTGFSVMNLSFDELLPDYLLQLDVFLLQFHYTKGWLAENGWRKRHIVIIRAWALATVWCLERLVLFAENFEKFQVLYTCDSAF